MEIKEMKSIHAGKVLQIIKRNFAEREFYLDDVEKILKNFGPGFENCHGSKFSLPELIDFFVMKGKLIEEDGKLKIAKEFSCSCSH